MVHQGRFCWYLRSVAGSLSGVGKVNICIVSPQEKFVTNDVRLRVPE